MATASATHATTARWSPTPRSRKDTNGNGIGDVCDPDLDGDGFPDKQLVNGAWQAIAPGATVTITNGKQVVGDNCPNIPNADQKITCNGTTPGIATAVRLLRRLERRCLQQRHRQRRRAE